RFVRALLFARRWSDWRRRSPERLRVARSSLWIAIDRDLALGLRRRRRRLCTRCRATRLEHVRIEADREPWRRRLRFHRPWLGLSWFLLFARGDRTRSRPHCLRARAAVARRVRAKASRSGSRPALSRPARRAPRRSSPRRRARAPWRFREL